MDGLSRVAGVGLLIQGCPIRVANPEKPGETILVKRDYTLGSMGVGEYAAAEAEYIRQRKTPLDAALPLIEKLNAKGLTNQANHIAALAYQDERKAGTKELGKPTLEEMTEWLDSFHGVKFTAKLCFMQKHPAITDDEVIQIFNFIGDEEMKRLRDRASGTDRLGNSIGPASTGRVPAQLGDQSPGNESTETLPTPTDGDRILSTV